MIKKEKNISSLPNTNLKDDRFEDVLDRIDLKAMETQIFVTREIEILLENIKVVKMLCEEISHKIDRLQENKNKI